MHSNITHCYWKNPTLVWTPTLVWREGGLPIPGGNTHTHRALTFLASSILLSKTKEMQFLTTSSRRALLASSIPFRSMRVPGGKKSRPLSGGPGKAPPLPASRAPPGPNLGRGTTGSILTSPRPAGAFKGLLALRAFSELLFPAAVPAPHPFSEPQKGDRGAGKDADRGNQNR